jgi:hypothetical protein
MPTSLLQYGEYSFAAAAKKRSDGGSVVFQITEPDQFARFFERIENNKSLGKGFDNFQQFLDAMAVAMDLEDRKLQNVLIRELHNQFCSDEKLVSKRIVMDTQIDLVFSTMSTIFEHKIWSVSPSVHGSIS